MIIETPGIPILDSISGLARRYDAWLTDIWGVMHNGLKPFPHAVEACRLFRCEGGTIILISNSPRPSETAAEQLRDIGVPEDCYDGIATSGDVTRKLIADYAGQTVFHLGPPRDLPIFDGLGVTLGGVGDSAVVVCSGLYDDETETPDNYADLLAELRSRNLPMICANPDLKVERGDRLLYCAGAIAEAYAALGGTVVYAGKPHKPIYDLALAKVIAKKGIALPRHRIVAIGDGVRTDIAGAAAQRIDSVFIASAVHVVRANGSGLDAKTLAALFSGNSARPIAALSQLSW